MKLLKPILDKNSYHIQLQKDIYEFLVDNIFRDLYAILLPRPIIRLQNSLDHGNPNMMFNGIAIHIENEAGSERKGRKWIQIMAHDYGYICQTQAIDGDELDCFVGNNHNAKNFYIVEQIKPGTKVFDEYKVMFGFDSLEEAKNAYYQNYQRGWKGLSHIGEYSMDKFWEWYARTKPVNELFNAAIPMLIKFLIEGKLTYEQNKYFKGKLNATISKQLRQLGAKYNKTVRAYQIDPIKLTPEIKNAIAQGNSKNRDKIQKAEQYLKSIEGRDLPSLGIELSFGKTITDLHKQFDSTTRKILPEDIEVSMASHHQEQLKDAYATNLDKYIKDWYEEQILRLRFKVMDNTLQGFRAENLINDIQEEQGVSYRKAKFLAKQETSLLTSKYREIRYTENNINYYVWSTSHDSRVRPTASTRGIARDNNHRILEGKIFRFDHPPIVDTHNGRRANPGEDFGCRCVAIPVLSDRQEIESKMKG